MLNMFKHWDAVDTVVFTGLFFIFVSPLIWAVVGFILYRKELKCRRIVGVVSSLLPFVLIIFHRWFTLKHITLICIGICLLNGLFYFFGSLVGYLVRKRKQKKR